MVSPVSRITARRGFFPLAILFATFLVLPCADAQQFLINEIDPDNPGSDTQEFVEILSVDAGGAPLGNASLDGLVLVLVNGNGEVSYAAFDLNGFETNANGYFVVGNPGVPNVDLVVDPGSAGAIQNGPDGIALYQGSIDDFPNGTSILNPPVGPVLVDAVVYGTSDLDDLELIGALTPAGFQLDDTREQSLARNPDGGSAFDSSRYAQMEPSPGASNVPSAELGLTFGASVLAESGGAITTATVSIDVVSSEDVVIQIANPDSSELAMPESVTILANESSAEFTIVSVDDAWADGDQMVTIEVSTPGVFPAFGTLTVTDDDLETVLVVNEIHAAVDFSGSNGDANLDGLSDSFDEFVEIVNVSDQAIDLSGFALRDRFLVRHTVLEGTILGPSCALVIFGGRATEGNPVEFGGAQVQNANGAAEFGLGLNDSGGDVVSLLNLDGQEIAGHVYATVRFSEGSLVRDPDLIGGFVQHESLNGGFPSFSPGLRNDGFAAFCDLGTLVLVADPPAVSEPDGTTELVVTRSGPITNALEVTLSTDDPGELSVPPSVTIPAGAASATVTVGAVDDSAADGTQTPAVTATAPGFVDATIRIDVNDDGDEAVIVWINEIDPDQAGADAAEFVELYDGGRGNTPLDGLLLVFFNGGNSSDASYLTIDLNGFSTDASGFFVVGSDGVPGAGLSLGGTAIQNGGPAGDAVALYRDSVMNFPMDTPPTDTNLVDAVIYNGVDDLLAFALGVTPEDAAPSDSEDEAIARVPDGGTPRDSSNFVTQAPTPGASNGVSGYAAWAAANGVAGEPEDDDDRDGAANIIEYALGFLPTLPDFGGLPTPTFNAMSQFVLEVNKGEAGGADPSLGWIVEVSTDLETWTTDETEVLVDDADRLVVAYTGSAANVQMRLRVTLAGGAQ